MIATHPAQLYPISVPHLATQLGLSISAVYRRTRHLVREGTLIWESKSVGTRGRVAYASLPEEALFVMLLGMKRHAADRSKWPLPKFLAIAVAEGRA